MLLPVKVSLTVGYEAGGNEDAGQPNLHLAVIVHNALKIPGRRPVVPTYHCISQVLAPSPLSPTGLLRHGLAR